MSKISDNIRAAALGPTPKERHYVYGWLNDRRAWAIAYGGLMKPLEAFCYANDTTRRTFLLLVAAALESK